MRGMTFWSNRQAAATALGAAVMTLMSLGGFALTADHTHLTYQRDFLKSATDAATLATTRHLWTLDPGLSDAALRAELLPLARRYILVNIPEHQRARAAETLTVTLVPNRAAGTVDISAHADLGGVLFSRWMAGNAVPTMRVGSLSEMEVANPPALPMIELVLAIDVTTSMLRGVEGQRLPRDSDQTRIAIVKQAAQQLVERVTGNTRRSVAVGLVPWSYRVRLNQATRTRWADLGWAQYPTRRYYPNPFLGQWQKTRTHPYPDPYREHPGGAWHDLPNQTGPWRGCVDQRPMHGDRPPGIHATLPTQVLFTMGFYTPTINDVRRPVSYECHPDPDAQYQCYSDQTHSRHRPPQDECPQSMPVITPLTSEVATLQHRIDQLRVSGAATYSTLGVVWGHRMLAPAWRTVWDDPVYPQDAASNVRKVLVLLTDGEDNQLGNGTVQREHRRQACDAAKAAGIEVMTIFVGSPQGGTRRELEWCASPGGEDATNAFTGETEEELEGVFEEIGRRIRPLRLVR